MPGKAFSATVCVVVVAAVVVGVAYVGVIGAVVFVADVVVAEERLITVVLPSGLAVTVFVTIEVIAEVVQAFKSVMEPAAPTANPAFFRNSLREISFGSSISIAL